MHCWVQCVGAEASSVKLRAPVCTTKPQRNARFQQPDLHCARSDACHRIPRRTDIGCGHRLPFFVPERLSLAPTDLPLSGLFLRKPMWPVLWHFCLKKRLEGDRVCAMLSFRAGICDETPHCQFENDGRVRVGWGFEGTARSWGTKAKPLAAYRRRP